MQKRRTRQSTLAISLFCLMVTSVSVVYADGFYTIIGPDGRPMVVPMKIGKPQVEPSKPKQDASTEQVSPPVSQDKKPVKSFPVPLEEKKEDPRPIESKPSQSKPIKNIETAKPASPQQKEVSASPAIPVKTTRLEQTSPISTGNVKMAQEVSANIANKEKPLVVNPPATVQQKVIAPPTVPDEVSHKDITTTGFSQVDGVDYVNSEYLENQEFNLEGKKRFYSMPDASGRLETIERKKGVSRSVLDKLLNRSRQSTAPIALAGTYVRLSSEDLKSAFENDRCFIDGYKKSIKTLSAKKDIGLWPRKPLKEKFEYELVKLDPAIQYMQIDSYSSNNEKPVYYWPLVVFLDEKGCIEEGVSGFKNGITAATVLQHSAIQGVIKVPKDVRYMMMTPLASAVDVSEQELSNQGQLKISVLQ